MRTRAFTLIELLITLVIIGILAGTAYPLYTSHVTKTRRAAAEAGLLTVAGKMERYYIQHHTYAGANLASLGLLSEESFYKIEIISAEQQGFELHAIPQGPQAVADEKCGTLTLNAQGNKGISGLGSASTCWG